MNQSRRTIEDSYRYCRRMSRRAGSSFHAGFLLLPAERRRAMWALYAFMRHTDDLVDRPTADYSPREALSAWRAALHRALGETEKKEERREKRDSAADNSSFIIHNSSFDPLLPALADAVRRFHVPPEHLFAVIDGVEMDLDARRHETFDDLREYCERVASAVGLACIHVWGFRGPEAFAPARAAGIALQLTNILRDLKEDAAAGRVYLPLVDLRECGYSADDFFALAAGNRGATDGRGFVADKPSATDGRGFVFNRDRFRRLIALEVARAERFYAESAELLDMLDPAGRRIFGITMSTYRALLRRIARRPEMVLRRRAGLRSAEKLRLLARWALLPPRKADLL